MSKDIECPKAGSREDTFEVTIKQFRTRDTDAHIVTAIIENRERNCRSVISLSSEMTDKISNVLRDIPWQSLTNEKEQIC